MLHNQAVVLHNQAVESVKNVNFQPKSINKRQKSLKECEKRAVTESFSLGMVHSPPSGEGQDEGARFMGGKPVGASHTDQKQVKQRYRNGKVLDALSRPSNN